MHALVVKPPAQIRFALNIDERPIFPSAAVAVIRTGFPNEYPPISSTLNPFTCPTRDPAKSTSSVPSSIISRMRVSIRLCRSIFAESAVRTCAARTTDSPAFAVDVCRLARQIRNIHKSRRHLVPPPRLPHAILQNRRKRPAVEWRQILFLHSARNRPAYSAITPSLMRISSSNSTRTLKIFRKSSSYSYNISYKSRSPIKITFTLIGTASGFIALPPNG